MPPGGMSRRDRDRKAVEREALTEWAKGQLGATITQQQCEVIAGFDHVYEAATAAAEELKKMERAAGREKARCWGSLYPLYLDHIVEPGERELGWVPKRGDLVVITNGEYMGHVGEVEGVTGRGGYHSSSYAVLRRLWPTDWRGPSSSYWAPEHRLECLHPLVPVMPVFATVEQADRWMEESRELAVGQDVEFVLTPGSVGVEWRHRYDPITYRGQLVEIECLHRESWLRHRPAAMGKFRVLHFDDDLNPSLTWVTSLVRL